MYLARYTQLAAEICQELGLNLADNKNLPLNFEFNNCEFSIGYGFGKDLEGMFIYCVVGELPTTGQADLLRHLLEVNLQSFGSNTPTYCYDATNKKLMQTLRLEIIDNAQAIINILLILSSHVEGLRQKYSIPRTRIHQESIEQNSKIAA